ncbi:uncharacterized protein LOC124369589 isoform X1 [Homalodisca vitripennis]|nr:uncharacterized protein LOC124369589 isoform X1 [Homalodisca vitripennis]
MRARPLLSFLIFLITRTLSVTATESREEVLEQSGNVTIREGKDTTIKCTAGASSEIISCVWLWEFPGRDHAPTVVAGFPGHGLNSSDCSINLVNVSQIQTGWWTCRAQTANTTILHSEPIFLQVFTGPIVTFELKPVNRTFSIGGEAELECKTAIPVVSCQWSFQQQGQSEPLVVTEGPPKGATDCSFRLEHVSYEQVGAWRCGARTDNSDHFTFTDTVYIQVEHKEEAFPVEFTEEPKDTEMRVGETGTLQCKVHEESHIEDCRWYWQPLGRNKPWRVLMREFLPDKNDCSIMFSNITWDPEGLWSCHVKPIHSNKFKASRSAQLTVRGDIIVSTLSREISVAEGEQLMMSCVAEEPAKGCQWRRRSLTYTEVEDPFPWVVFRTLQPVGNESRDCSLLLDHVLMKHQGLWVCSIRFQDDEPYHDAMPTVVTVKTPSKVHFLETPRTQLAAENRSVTLNCSTHSAVHECVWTWYEDESKVSERVVKYNFTSVDGYDCSVVVPAVERNLQGIWQCAVRYGDPLHPNVSYARPFSLTVVKTGPIVFRAVAKWVHVLKGSSSVLECVVQEPVEECIWFYQNETNSNQASSLSQITRFQPTNFNNCSLRIEGISGAMEGSGWYTCGARNQGESNFTTAPPIRLDYAYPGNVTTQSLVSSTELLVLICQLSNVVPGASCDWMHPSEYNIFEFNTTAKYEADFNPETGSCSISFRPMLVDVGHWKCVFSVNNKNLILGEASFTVLSSPQNVRLSWIVGILATVTLMLTVLLFVVITCRFYQCSRNNKTMVQLNKPMAEHGKRYSEDPTKGINFSFTETPELLVDFSAPSPTPADSHHYEHVGSYLSPRPSFYQNVD